jgi:hypothetical protein
MLNATKGRVSSPSGPPVVLMMRLSRRDRVFHIVTGISLPPTWISNDDPGCNPCRRRLTITGSWDYTPLTNGLWRMILFVRVPAWRSENILTVRVVGVSKSKRSLYQASDPKTTPVPPVILLWRSPGAPIEQNHTTATGQVGPPSQEGLFRGRSPS